VLERILVLAIAQESNRDDTKPKVVNAVTLELTPEQVEKLDLARSVGTLSLVLRNQIDPNSANTEGATKSSLLDGVPGRCAGAGTRHEPALPVAPHRRGAGGASRRRRRSWAIRWKSSKGWSVVHNNFKHSLASENAT
jgi:pilus assembly protein CpaB